MGLTHEPETYLSLFDDAMPHIVLPEPETFLEITGEAVPELDPLCTVIDVLMPKLETLRIFFDGYARA